MIHVTRRMGSTKSKSEHVLYEHKSKPYYELEQVCIIIWDSFVLLQIAANVVANRGSPIKNWGKFYFRLGQVLEIEKLL